MNNPNARVQAERELPGRTVRRSQVMLVTCLTLLGLLFGACSSPMTNTASAAATSCPNAVQQLVDPQVTPDLEISLIVDGSGSFMGDRSTSRAFVAEQLALTIEEAVEEGAALRVIVFGGSAGNARTVVECPVMAVRYHNEAARRAKLAYLKQVACDQVWLAVVNGRPPMARVGTSVVGGYVALADSVPLTVAERKAVMLSDGIALPEAEVAVDLSGFGSVGMYGIGHTEPPPSTPEVNRLAQSWQAWLTRQGARHMVVSTQGYSPELRAAP